VREQRHVVFHRLAKTIPGSSQSCPTRPARLFGDATKVTYLIDNVGVRRIVLHRVRITLTMHGDISDAKLASDSGKTGRKSFSTLAPAATAARATDSFWCRSTPDKGAKPRTTAMNDEFFSSRRVGVWPCRFSSDVHDVAPQEK